VKLTLRRGMIASYLS